LLLRKPSPNFNINVYSLCRTTYHMYKTRSIRERLFYGDRRGRDRMVVEFTATYTYFTVTVGFSH